MGTICYPNAATSEIIGFASALTGDATSLEQIGMTEATMRSKVLAEGEVIQQEEGGYSLGYYAVSYTHLDVYKRQLVGHGINLFMSSISSFVHPMRLTFVEFYKNAGFEMAARQFEPLTKIDQSENK